MSKVKEILMRRRMALAKKKKKPLKDKQSKGNMSDQDVERFKGYSDDIKKKANELKLGE